VSPRWSAVQAEATNPQNYISGHTDDSYNRWPEDLALLKELNVNAYRFSIEWSRVEPEEGVFNADALAHYKSMISELKANQIEPFVTILHRTIPLWVASQGGWSNEKTVVDFSNYTNRLIETFGQLVRYWMPLNEPVLNVGGGFIAGTIPPNKKNPFTALVAHARMTEAHNQAYTLIHEKIPHAQVGPAHAAVYAEAEGGHWYNQLLVNIIHYLANWKFLDGIKNSSDFIGIQYYTRGVIGLRKSKFLVPLPGNIPQSGPASDMGQEIYPEGLYKYAELVWQRYKKPIIVTENGIADRDDTLRPEYIQDHIAEVEKLIANKIDVRGYFHWSLLDNFEWDKGFWPKFGLASVEKTTFIRTLKPSAQTYKNIIKQSTTI
jgi:beta-glucosidase